MKPFRMLTGKAAFLDRSDVDTDQIIPKQFLKRIERTGYGQFLFYNWRYLKDEKENPAFELNKEKYQGASILVTQKNFGCGSSREHAVWALKDYGFAVIIAPSFADIFRNNCIKNSLLPIVLSEQKVQELFEKDRNDAPVELAVDLEKQSLSCPDGWFSSFEIDPFSKHMLLAGLDDIGLTLQQEAKIAAYEQQKMAPGSLIPQKPPL